MYHASVTLVRPKSAVHCVTPTAGGRRDMLKVILTGDYRKGRIFQRFAHGQCSEENENRHLMRKRSEEMARAYEDDREAFEL
ncbi:hypothetical protein FOZ63_030124 [Perkinsus olseni]|uniref:Uncharacterized protein n=1 Tax=Perkinsus olseni TaxID=32597 RepID=A0A7J6RKL9_PEROL|nr:hypothetical protein FOZ63_030124 [Perkinsus olseni]